MAMRSTNPAASRVGRLAAPLLLAAVTVILFDLAAWFLVPRTYTAFSSSYGKTRLLSPASAGQPAMTRPFPRHYFRADPDLGFDINPGARGIDEVDNHPYEIFANTLGCFDRNELDDFRRAPAYYYFAGDSFTWGFAPYESKFATQWERLTGKVAAKCGVTHTGQAHQFEKFRRFMAAVGKPPAAVYVGFYANDPINDAGHPHTTIVGGYMADIVFLKDGALVRPDPDAVRQVVEASIREIESHRPGLVERLKTRVWVFSLSANIANHAVLALARMLRGVPPRAAPGSAGAATGRFGDNLYYWYEGEAMKTRYLTDPRVAANKAAIQRWARHAREHSYRLVLLLFPPKERFDDVEFFAQVKRWLDAQGIEHLDLAPLFREQGFKVQDLYWATNGHWHAEGNRIVGRLLAARLP